MDKDDEEDIVFIDIKDSIKDNEENNLKQRKINTLQNENNVFQVCFVVINSCSDLSIILLVLSGISFSI